MRMNKKNFPIKRLRKLNTIIKKYSKDNPLEDESNNLFGISGATFSTSSQTFTTDSNVPNNTAYSIYTTASLGQILVNSNTYSIPRSTYLSEEQNAVDIQRAQDQAQYQNQLDAMNHQQAANVSQQYLTLTTQQSQAFAQAQQDALIYGQGQLLVQQPSMNSEMRIPYIFPYNGREPGDE